MSYAGQRFAAQDDAAQTVGSDAWRLVPLGMPPDRAIRIAAAARSAKSSGAALSPPNTRMPQAHLSARNRSYLDRYANAVIAQSRAHDVDPTFLLGVGCAESGCASGGTYTRTNDAFGMTNGNIHRMNQFLAGPAGVKPDVQRFFDLYGQQVKGAGKNENAFINALLGENPGGVPVRGWRHYNAKLDYPAKLRADIRMMRRDLPVWEQMQTKSPATP